MLESLSIKNFTVFESAEIQFSPQLNIIVGENGTGKSLLLKLAYCILEVSARGSIKQDAPSKSFFETQLAEKLVNVFKPDSLGRLVHRKVGVRSGQVKSKFSKADYNLGFSLNSKSSEKVSVDPLPTKNIEKLPVFLPTRELLTLQPGFTSLYETTRTPFEETWRDTSLLLSRDLARGPRAREIGPLLSPLEEIMGGNLYSDTSGRFYIQTEGSGILEISLVAEGLRKIATIARLIANGSLSDKGFLFWDEPESNLNPKVIRQVAKTILELCKQGIQTFVATHSLFLLREIDILLSYPDNKMLTKYLVITRNGGRSEVKSYDEYIDAEPIVALDEELMQSDRYMESPRNE